MKRILITFSLIISLLLVTSCSNYFSKKELHQSNVTPDLHLSANTGNAKFKARWWEDYGSPELNKLVEEALAQNLTLKIAQARVKEARAKMASYNANRFPQVDLGYDYEKEKNADGSISDDSNYFFTPTYTVDLWGANYALYKSYENKFIAQEFQAKAAAMTIISEVVSTWLKIRFGQKEYDLLNEQLHSYEGVLKYQLNNYTQGTAADQDILNNQNKIQQFTTRIYQNIIKVDGLRYELAYLIGRSPAQDIKISNKDLPPLIPLPAKGLSSDLIKDRPDIKSAWYTLIAADWDEHNSKLAMLPTFDISVKFSDVNLGSVLGSWSKIANTVTYTAMDWGRLRSGVAEKKAIVERNVATYVDTVYRAIVEVRNELIKNKHQLEQISWFENQLKLAQAKYNEAKVNAENGGGDSISVIFKLINLRNDELALVRENEKLNLRRVNLYNSLGGNVWKSNSKAS
ncbi:MAG: TolC family protein [Pseudomonadota bacterium]|nr:TolC family protein [Pseudomonadota bacterium]